MNIFVIIIWILVTLFVSSFSAVLGKKYGVEYPIAIMAVLVVTANVLANKIVAFGPFNVPAGIVVYSTTFLLTDILCEKWGKSYAKKAVWAGFYGNLIFIISLYIAMYWQAAPFAQEIGGIFTQALKLSPRIALAGLIAYVISQNHDVWSFLFWKRKTHGKHLWLRNNLSTIVSQFIDSLIFVTIAFYGIYPVWQMIFGLWVVKIIIAILDTPFIYLAVNLIDRINPSRK